MHREGQSSVLTRCPRPSTQTQAVTPNMLRTHATSFTMLGIALGFFICDSVISFKYNVRLGLNVWGISE